MAQKPCKFGPLKRPIGRRRCRKRKPYGKRYDPTSARAAYAKRGASPTATRYYGTTHMPNPAMLARLRAQGQRPLGGTRRRRRKRR